tara:strand:- start:90 stop:2009 length:1920 start_codon:yes stop_codon:yes gene_type:complete
MSFSLDTLTEGIKARNVGQGNRRLLEKWGRTGLLRGLEGTGRENMATLLENQAGQALRESSSLGGGTPGSADIRGFSNIAFPIVRRVFGSLIANELVSIQPMSLPSGLLFYLDYTYGTSVGADGSATDNSYEIGQSIYGLPTNPGKNGPAEAIGGQYDLAGSGYSRKHKKLTGAALPELAAANYFTPGAVLADNDAAGTVRLVAGDASWFGYDPQLKEIIDADDSVDGNFVLVAVPVGAVPGADLGLVKEISLFANTAITSQGGGAFLKEVPSTIQGGDGVLNVRRLNRLVKGTTAEILAATNPTLATAEDATHVLMVLQAGADAFQYEVLDTANGGSNHIGVSFIQAAGAAAGSGDDLSTVVSPAFESDFALDAGDIPEIDIKIESVSVVAQTRKLRAKWSPELAQDLNAYHSLDAEVELTQILSEQVALEIDREILGDLLSQAGAANFFWSRAPGKFVNKRTGAEALRSNGTTAPGPAFTGTVREWYETLVETIIDVSNEIHRKTLRGAGNFIVVSPEVATVLEASVLYKPTLTLDADGQVASPMVLGAEKVGTLSSRFTVYKDPYFPRHKILVGFKGSSYLETGYVYAPYVPLIVTPTIFAPEDFTPRKGVMTRYGKKMVRADFYGTVTCLDMNII